MRIARAVRRGLGVVAVAVGLGMCFIAGAAAAWAWTEPGTPNTSLGDTAVASRSAAVRQLLSERYYRPLSPDILAAATADSSLSTLGAVLDDPYTSYLTPEQRARWAESDHGDYPGIGVVLAPGRAPAGRARAPRSRRTRRRALHRRPSRRGQPRACRQVLRRPRS